MSADDSRQAGEERATARVFFALWPPPEVARQLAAAAENFAVQAGGGATRRETIHLTLAFLGAVPVDRLADLEGAARRVRSAPFELVIDRYGFWRHNRIFWAGCGRIPEALDALAGKLAATLADAGFSGAEPGRVFAPHVTLARKVRDGDPTWPTCPPLAWPCRHFVLMRSRLSARGPDYETLAVFPLSA